MSHRLSLVNRFRPDLFLDPVQVRKNCCVNPWYRSPAGLTKRRDSYNTVIVLTGSGAHQQRTAAVSLTGVRSSRNVCIYYAQHILIQTARQFTEAGERLGAWLSIHHTANHSIIVANTDDAHYILFLWNIYNRQMYIYKFIFRWTPIYLRLGVFINLVLLSSSKLVAPQPITIKSVVRDISTVSKDFVWMQIGLTLLPTLLTGVRNFKIATSW